MIRGKLFRALVLGLVLIFPLVAFPARAQEPEEFPQGPEGGAMLAEKMRSLQPEDNAKWSGTLKILHRAQKVPPIPVICETISSGTNWSVMYSTTATAAIGVEKLTVVHSTNRSNVYFYACAAAPGGPLGEPRELTGAEADIPLADTDFWLSDLGFEFFHWSGQRLLKGELRSVAGASRSCYVLESINPNPTPASYSRVISWIEKEHGAPLAMKAYAGDNTNRLAKEFELGSFKKNKETGHYELKDLQVDNNKVRSTTRLEFDLGVK
jgi:hypothetical protein